METDLLVAPPETVKDNSLCHIWCEDCDVILCGSEVEFVICKEGFSCANICIVCLELSEGHNC